jgi:cystathionine beta-lyase/cystathionine gamma-synthase
VSGGEEHAVAVCGRTKVFTLGESLGGVESLIEAGAVQLKVKALLLTRLRGGNASVKPCLRVPGDLRVVHQC